MADKHEGIPSFEELGEHFLALPNTDQLDALDRHTIDYFYPIWSELSPTDEEGMRRIGARTLSGAITLGARLGYAFKEAELALNPKTVPELTEESMREQFGYRLMTVFDTFTTDKAGVVGFHDELDRFEETFGPENVIGSIFVEDNQQVLGVFVRESSLPEQIKS